MGASSVRLALSSVQSSAQSVRSVRSPHSRHRRHAAPAPARRHMLQHLLSMSQHLAPATLPHAPLMTLLTRARPPGLVSLDSASRPDTVHTDTS
jgi:hypothetical protein